MNSFLVGIAWKPFLPVVCWSMGSLFTARAAKHYGPTTTNRLRLLLAALVLGLFHIFGGRLDYPSIFWIWLLISGAIGLGFGDMGMMLAYRRIGAKTTSLILLCLSTPIAGILEWFLYGTMLKTMQLWYCGAILTGVTLVVWPSRRATSNMVKGRPFYFGVAFALLGALGQGVSTVISRMAYFESGLAQQEISGISAAWIRILGGCVVMVLITFATGLVVGKVPIEETLPKVKFKALEMANPAVAMGFSVMLGPVLGLSAYQWALVEHPAPLVQGIVALSPVAMIPLAWMLDGDRPTMRDVMGASLACAGAALLSISAG